MIKHRPQQITGDKAWLADPSSDHFVYFYQSDSRLIDSLVEYIDAGITRLETCVLLITPDHRRVLEARLTMVGHDVTALSAEKKLFFYDAESSLKRFMVGDKPDETKFVSLITEIFAEASHNNTPIRSFGEMVALLWKGGNQTGATTLENFWNNIAKSFDFTLYCAYPALHFVMCPDELTDVSACHSAYTTNPIT